MNSRLKRSLAMLWVVTWLGLLTSVLSTQGAGVTLITHGLNGNVTDWIIPMCNKIAQYRMFPGTNVSIYEISVTQSSPGVYATTQTFLDGVSPLESDSGEILIALDWSTISSGGTPTTAVAAAAAQALLATNFIPELRGRALVELPLHLAGHSRGASVVTELASLLGAKGVWVDQVTCLDPYPVSLFGDPAMNNYANIFFTDNYWQSLGFPGGQALAGAYNRQLTTLNGGYSLPHSDVHLWYHGTIDLTTPASDTGATITSAERSTWWTALESTGTNAGFLYSTMGRGDRFSTLEPAGSGNGRIRDGVNKIWDFGAGVAANRTRLPHNDATWPNIIRLVLGATNSLPIGQPIPLTYYQQSGSNSSASVDLRIYLDADSNPYTTNEIEILHTSLTGTGTNAVYTASANPVTDPARITPGNYRVLARISDGVHTRYTYTPGFLSLTASQQPPVLVDAGSLNGVFGFSIVGIPGQEIVVQMSQDLVSWRSFQTNILATQTLFVSDPSSVLSPLRYYRAVLAP